MKPPKETHRTWEKSSWWGYQLFSIPRSSSFKVALALGRAPLSSPPSSGLANVLEKGKDQGLRKVGRHPLLLGKRARLFNNIAYGGLDENSGGTLAEKIVQELGKSESIARVELNLRQKEGSVEKGSRGRKRRFLRMARGNRVEEVGGRNLEAEKKENPETFLRFLMGCTKGSNTDCVDRLSVPCHHSSLSSPKERRGWKFFRILK